MRGGAPASVLQAVGARGAVAPARMAVTPDCADSRPGRRRRTQLNAAMMLHGPLGAQHPRDPERELDAPAGVEPRIAVRADGVSSSGTFDPVRLVHLAAGLSIRLPVPAGRKGRAGRKRRDGP